jgi:hypothetical protein
MSLGYWRSLVYFNPQISMDGQHLLCDFVADFEDNEICNFGAGLAMTRMSLWYWRLSRPNIDIGMCVVEIISSPSQAQHISVFVQIISFYYVPLCAFHVVALPTYLFVFILIYYLCTRVSFP